MREKAPKRCSFRHEAGRRDDRLTKSRAPRQATVKRLRLAGEAGIEPATRGFGDRRSATELHSHDWHCRKGSNLQDHGSQPGHPPRVLRQHDFSLKIHALNWCQWGELNTRLSGYGPDALAAELHWRVGGGSRCRAALTGFKGPCPCRRLPYKTNWRNRGDLNPRPELERQGVLR